MFGQQQPASGGGLFGSKPTGTGLFGAPATTPTLQTGFGQQQQPQQQQSTGLFGAPAQQPQQQQSTYGQTQQQPQQSGGLFGQPQQQQQQPQTGGMFGQQTQQPAQQSGGLFGQAQPQQQGGGLFGQQQQPQQQQGGLFGQPQAQQQQGGLFGQPQAQQQTGGMFGQQQQQPQQQPQQQMGQSLFGGQQQQQPQQQNNFGGSMMNPQQQQQMQMQAQGSTAVLEKISRVKNSWDLNHPDYAFRTYLYNSIGKERASQYQKPPGDDNSAWEKAWAERPNAECVPVRVDGFKDLDQRVKSQENQIQMFRNELYMIQDKLNQIQNRHDLTTSIKLEDCRRRHIALARRSLSLAAKVQVLKNRGYALQPEEEQLKKRLEGLSRLVNDPASSGRMNEIWARMMVVQEKAKVMEESVGKVDIMWDEKQLQVAGKLLQSNSAGLEYLLKEVKDIEKLFAEWEAVHKQRTAF